MNTDERRFIVSGLYRRGAGSLPVGLRQWRRAEGRGLGIGERRAQDFGVMNADLMHRRAHRQRPAPNWTRWCRMC